MTCPPEGKSRPKKPVEDRNSDRWPKHRVRTFAQYVADLGLIPNTAESLLSTSTTDPEHCRAWPPNSRYMKLITLISPARQSGLEKQLLSAPCWTQSLRPRASRDRGARLLPRGDTPPRSVSPGEDRPQRPLCSAHCAALCLPAADTSSGTFPRRSH